MMTNERLAEIKAQYEKGAMQAKEMYKNGYIDLNTAENLAHITQDVYDLLAEVERLQKQAEWAHHLHNSCVDYIRALRVVYGGLPGREKLRIMGEAWERERWEGSRG